MNLSTFAAAAALAVAAILPLSSSAAPSKGQVLVVMSSTHELQLRDGRQYATGCDLNEFVVPYRKRVDAGYEPVIANPMFAADFGDALVKALDAARH